MMISKEDVKHIASLAKLKFSEEEIDEFTHKFAEVLDYVAKLNEVDTENVEPTYQVYDYNQRLREDIVKEGLSREEILQNSIENQWGYFKLLKIVE
ncbi:Asp-tRNA(Asn)/Glu-tRNA(Gln) amidotransferase subunit GatC [Tissierella praeacuta]|uniref:Aspartyl/glutamyl-tRNA(Asn/Gln) amidotransferase subunit C n=2 Tax=Tissierella praeacuta TaxID=43131 RepID=A0A1M4W7Q9_9FIRM|nr:Asp-tRNA(Asn)/Glu-tRNA(Gln) amidotransferase subunit GatC [Tissierella praeacuta]SHE77133.1 aspartyl/glutamyl-tRNA(Asn/Gln) amidotransferase subunit C [Tissierella praeacuta DSM 18095]HAE92353.1 Asp-tRNA(Asn)/Glu-tRNA(Gln) amidotransferase subunit GatC [Tissierella sp.]MBU5256123.1 Asp-tRNA(Asn)/Glu-tRNA(Gln) amidotransferase subunit GatC [Tissierella praeacuta]TCU75580.1 aspartyl/glutamyl-tRNA(Asn/Gln) amidotransferase subunit C [Tissierella praeacuta]SUP00017.1 Aspartyl/glutamyl-tRNA(Asn/